MVGDVASFLGITDRQMPKENFRAVAVTLFADTASMENEKTLDLRLQTAKLKMMIALTPRTPWTGGVARKADRREWLLCKPKDL